MHAIRHGKSALVSLLCNHNQPHHCEQKLPVWKRATSSKLQPWSCISQLWNQCPDWNTFITKLYWVLRFLPPKDGWELQHNVKQHVKWPINYWKPNHKKITVRRNLSNTLLVFPFRNMKPLESTTKTGGTSHLFFLNPLNQSKQCLWSPKRIISS